MVIRHTKKSGQHQSNENLIHLVQQQQKREKGKMK